MKVGVSTISIRIDVDFPDCENDMVFKEIGSGIFIPPPLVDGATTKIDKSKLSKTPTAESVDFCLNYLAGFVCLDTMEICKSKPLNYFNDFEGLGLEVQSWYGLMMSTCHLVLEIDADIFHPTIIKSAQKIVQKVFKKHLVYYESEPVS